MNTPNATVEMTLGGRTFALSATLPILGAIKRLTGKNILKAENPLVDVEPERIADVIAEMAKPNDKAVTAGFVLQHVDRSNLKYVLETAARVLAFEDEEVTPENP